MPQELDTCRGIPGQHCCLKDHHEGYHRDVTGAEFDSFVTTDASIERFVLLGAAVEDQAEDMRSLEKLYARTLDQVWTYEQALDVVRQECNRLLEENRQQRADLIAARGCR